MKSFYRAAIAASFLLPLPAQAQPVLIATDEPVCFMSVAGRTIDLTAMCGTPRAIEPTVEAAPERVVDEAQVAQYAAVSYGDAFCEARGQGLTGRQASERASRAAGDFILNAGASPDLITAQWFDQAQAASRSLCPDLQPTGRYD